MYMICLIALVTRPNHVCSNVAFNYHIDQYTSRGDHTTNENNFPKMCNFLFLVTSVLSVQEQTLFYIDACLLLKITIINPLACVQCTTKLSWNGKQERFRKIVKVQSIDLTMYNKSMLCLTATF